MLFLFRRLLRFDKTNPPAKLLPPFGFFDLYTFCFVTVEAHKPLSLRAVFALCMSYVDRD